MFFHFVLFSLLLSLLWPVLLILPFFPCFCCSLSDLLLLFKTFSRNSHLAPDPLEGLFIFLLCRSSTLSHVLL